MIKLIDLLEVQPRTTQHATLEDFIIHYKLTPHLNDGMGYSFWKRTPGTDKILFARLTYGDCSDFYRDVVKEFSEDYINTKFPIFLKVKNIKDTDKGMHILETSKPYVKKRIKEKNLFKSNYADKITKI